VSAASPSTSSTRIVDSPEGRRHSVHPATLATTWRNDLIDVGITAAGSVVMLLLMLRGLLAKLVSPMGDVDVIGNAAGISLHWSVPQFGFPFDMKFVPYFPTFELTQTALAQGFLSLTGNPYLAQNLVWLLSFPMTAVAAWWVFRLLRTPRPLAIALALAATFTPYHVFRAFYHPWLSTMWPAVLGVGLCILVGTGRAPRVRGVRLRSQEGAALAGTTLVCLLVAYGGIYYAFFTVVLLGVTLGWRAVQLRPGGGGLPRLIRDAYPVGVVVLAVTMALFSTSLVNAQDPPIRPVAARAPVDSGYFAGNLTFGLSPSPLTWVPGARQVTSPLAHAVNAKIEGSTYGQFGTVVVSMALVVLIVGLLVRRRRRLKDDSAHIDWRADSSLLMTLLVAAGAMFVPDGAGYAFAAFVTPAIRSWDRILPMLTTLTLAAAVALTTELGLLARRRTMAIAAAAVIVLTLFDGVLPYHRPIGQQLDQGAARMATGKAYAEAVNRVTPGKCGILQLPFMPFPESPPTGHLPDYSHFVVAMTNTDKLWSYGAVKYTSAGLWQMRLGNSITSHSLDALRAVGFCGVHVDTRGFDRATLARTVANLTSLLGPPKATGHSGDWLFFPIAGGRRNVGAIRQPGRLSQAARDFFFSRELAVTP
jgi:phosphoglycerol transferase